MSKSDFSHTVSLSQFSGAQTEQIFERLREERQLTVCNENAPIAVLLSPEENYRLLLLAQDRLEKNDVAMLSEADVMPRLGISETEIAQATDLEIETDDQYLRSNPSNLKRLLASIDQLKREK